MLLLIPAVIVLVIAGLLIVPFHISMNLRKEGFCFIGFYEVTFLGLVIRNRELLRPKKADDIMEADLRVEHNVTADEARESDSGRFQKDHRMLIDAFPAFYRFLKNIFRYIHIKGFRVASPLDLMIHRSRQHVSPSYSQDLDFGG